nr:uncharacterized protein LOC109158743 [Ipomoea trifida]
MSLEEDDLLARSKKKTKTLQDQQSVTQVLSDGMEGIESSTETQQREMETAPKRSHIRPEPELKEPFGSWMLAKKVSRRGRQSSNRGMETSRGEGLIGVIGKTTTPTLKVNGNSYNTRFAVLDTGEAEIEQTQEVMKEILIQSPKNKSPTTKSPLSSKGKRPSVQISEKQIINDKEPWAKRGSNTSAIREHPQRNGECSSRNMQAAAQAEHTVVRGNNTNGGNVSITVVTHESDEQFFGVPETMNEEHHNDPPDPLVDSMDEDPSSSDTRDPICTSKEDPHPSRLQVSSPKFTTRSSQPTTVHDSEAAVDRRPPSTNADLSPPAAHSPAFNNQPSTQDHLFTPHFLLSAAHVSKTNSMYRVDCDATKNALVYNAWEMKAKRRYAWEMKAKRRYAYYDNALMILIC